MNKEFENNNSENKEEIEGNFTVYTHRGWKKFHIIATAVFAVCSVIFLTGIFFVEENLYYGIIAALLAILFLITIFTGLTKLEVNGRNLTYTKSFGRRIYFAIDEITKVFQKEYGGLDSGGIYLRIEIKWSLRIKIYDSDKVENFPLLRLYLQKYIPERCIGFPDLSIMRKFHETPHWAKKKD